MTDQVNEDKDLAAASLGSPRPALEHGRCWGVEFCPHPGQPCIDGCYYCGRNVGALDGNHDHTEYEKGRYSCVCSSC